MKFEKTKVMNFENAFRGMRNPKNSWHKSDSYLDDTGNFVIGEADMNLAQTLIRAGSEHRKFMRQIFISVDISAPLYWYKEFDTYKVGTTANSTSTMHTIQSKPITVEDSFETDDYNPHLEVEYDFYDYDTDNFVKATSDLHELVYNFVAVLEGLRKTYVQTKDKRYWKELIRWTPEAWMQTRTITMTYENLYSMCHQRGNHKLNEWSGEDNPAMENFIEWARTLPYAKELIFLDETKEKRE